MRLRFRGVNLFWHPPVPSLRSTLGPPTTGHGLTLATRLLTLLAADFSTTGALTVAGAADGGPRTTDYWPLNQLTTWPTDSPATLATDVLATDY